MGIFDIKPWRKKKAIPSEPEAAAPTVAEPTPTEAVATVPTETPAKVSAEPPVVAEDKTIEDRVTDQIRLVYDPEIPVNVYEMGLIYDVAVEGEKAIVQMTLTSPQCPAAQEIPVDIKNRIEELSEISEAQVDIIWEPPWEPDMMSEMAKMELGMF